MVLEDLDFSMDPAETRYCVIDYINHRIIARGYQWSHCPPLLDPPKKLEVLMREKGDDFEERYQAQFQDLVEQLHITQNTAYSMFKSIVEELFSGGINWGRIVALFAFGGSLAVRCVETGMPNLVDSVVEWITIYVEQHLQTWIVQHGGWQGFVDFYSQRHNNADQDNPWDGSRAFKIGVLGALGAVALGAFLTQRT